MAYGYGVCGMRLLKKFASLELPLLLFYCSAALLLYRYGVCGMRRFYFCSRNLYGCENSQAFRPATTFCCSAALLLCCSSALFLLSLFTASRFTQKNLPYPFLNKRDFKLRKCLIYGFSTALLLYCSSAP